MANYPKADWDCTALPHWIDSKFEMRMRLHAYFFDNNFFNIPIKVMETNDYDHFVHVSLCIYIYALSSAARQATTAV